MNAPAATPLATRFAPSLRLLVAHFGLGIVGFVVFSVALVLRSSQLQGHFFQPQLLGLVHLCVLGWLMPITLGALHQLVPVVFEVPLRSERVVWAAFGMYVLGASGFIVHLWRFHLGVGFVQSATLLALALWLYLAQLFAAVRHSQVRTLTGSYVVCAFGYLALAAGFGLALAFQLHAPYLAMDHLRLLRVHAHLAGLGFFGLLVMGVSFRLLEMFLISHVREQMPGRVALWSLHAALAALALHQMVLPEGPWLSVAAGLSLIGVIAYLVQVRRLYRARMRRRPDVPWRHTAASFVYLLLAASLGVVGVVLRLPAELEQRLQLTYGFLALTGFVGSVIVGQLHKILPFLIWFHRFSPYLGLRKLPAAGELLPQKPQQLQWWLMHLGIASTAAGLFVGSGALRAGGSVLLCTAALLFARNMWVIYGSRP